jgi:SAM-dependent methyltransferase
MILERLFSATPQSTRRVIRKVKYYVMGSMSSASYWNTAAKISARAAIHTDCVDDQQFFESAKREANLARKMGVLGPNVRTLDVGCGIGRVEHAIHAEVHSIVGVDVSYEMVRRARDTVPAQNVSFQTVDGRSLNGIESEHYDLCLSFMVLQHIPRAAVTNYVIEVGRVLKPGGRFLFQIPLPEPNGAPEPPANHPFGVRYYTVGEVEDLLRSGRMILLERFNEEAARAPDDPALDGPEYQFYLAQRIS